MKNVLEQELLTNSGKEPGGSLLLSLPLPLLFQGRGIMIHPEAAQALPQAVAPETSAPKAAPAPAAVAIPVQQTVSPAQALLPLLACARSQTQ